MNIFLSAFIILFSLMTAGCIYFRHVKDKDAVDSKVRFTMIILMCEALLVTCNLIAGGEVMRRLPLDLTVCIIGFSATTSSIWDDGWIRGISCVVTAVLVTMSLYYVMAAADMIPMMPVHCIPMAVVAASAVLMLLQSISIIWRIRDVHAVMKAGTVWQSLSLSVDVFYSMMVIFDLLVYLLLDSLLPEAIWYSCVVSFILSSVTIAFGVRVLDESLFVLHPRHERTIVESMKISYVEMANDSTKENDTYREIYDRIIMHFDQSLPYLNSELTIDDVGKGVFSNKLYVSRAISLYTGRNFCQFVNYYRVAYSVNLFRQNPELKIMELANASGFNTVASFGTAFKLFMNENPSDWCRKERVLLIKGKNKLWNP